MNSKANTTELDIEIRKFIDSCVVDERTRDVMDTENGKGPVRFGFEVGCGGR